MDKLEIGKEYFFIKFNPRQGLPGGEFNLDNYEVNKGILEEINNGIYLVNSKELGLIELKNTLLFRSKDEAESYRMFHLMF